MTQEDAEKQTLANTIAIKELTTVANQTSKDVDKIVSHIERLIPIHEAISNIKTFLAGATFIVIGFGGWITLEHFSESKSLYSHISKSNERHENIDKIMKHQEELTEKNKNQIQYNKGRITGLYKKE